MTKIRGSRHPVQAFDPEPPAGLEGPALRFLRVLELVVADYDLEPEVLAEALRIARSL